MIKESKNKIIINNHFYIPNESMPYFQNFILNISSFNQSQASNLFIDQKNENKIIPNGLNKDNNDAEKIEPINFGINKINYKENENKFPLEKTNDKTIIEKNNNKTKDSKFLRFFKIANKKKIGRKPKSSIINSYHTKFSNDNILRKIKVKFFNKVINYINSIIISKYRNKINTLKRFEKNVSQNNTINFNKALINSKLKDIFYNYEINRKFKLIGKDFNKKIINKIYEEKIQELIDIFEMTFLEVFSIFRNLNETEKLKGLEKIDSVLRELGNPEENLKYINKFNEVAQKFETFYMDKIARKI